MGNRKMIKAQDVVEWFSSYNNPSPMQKKALDKGLYIDTKCRKELLLGEWGGKMIVGGRVRHFQFKNLGGGVWSVTLEKLRDE